MMLVCVAILSSLALADSKSDEIRQVIFSPVSNATVRSPRFSDKPPVKMAVAEPAPVSQNKFVLSPWHAADGTYSQKLSAIRPGSSQTATTLAILVFGPRNFGRTFNRWGLAAPNRTATTNAPTALLSEHHVPAPPERQAARKKSESLTSAFRSLSQ
jgi:hypothetical protein